MPIVCCFQKTSIKYILNKIKLEKSLQRNCFRFKWRICASVAFCNKICFWFIGKFNIFIAWSNFRYAFVAKSSLHICFQIKLENFDLWSKKLFCCNMQEKCNSLNFTPNWFKFEFTRIWCNLKLLLSNSLWGDVSSLFR